MANYYEDLVITSANPTALGPGDCAIRTTILDSGLLTLDGASAYDTLISGSAAYLAASNGAELSGTTVTEGGLLQVISPAGVMAATVVSGAGYFWLTGGAASGTVLVGNCIETVSGGATETGTRIGADAIQQIVDATVSGAAVSGVGGISVWPDGTSRAVATSAGKQMLGSGAVAYDTVVSAYGIQSVSSGAVAVGVRIENLGQQQVLAGGVARDVVMSSGTTEYQATYQLVEGIAGNTAVYAYGDHYVRFGGVTYDSEIYDKAWQTVAPGGTASGTIVHSGGLQGIHDAASGYSRGEAYDTVVESGGIQAVQSGYAERTVVFGNQQVWDLGSAVDTTIGPGGRQTVYGTALGNTISSGGRQLVGAGSYDAGPAMARGYASGNTVVGGEQWVTGDGVAEDNVFYGGSQVLQAGSAVNNRLHQALQYVENAVVLSTVIVGGTQNLAGSGLASRSVLSQGRMFVNPGASAVEARLYGGAHYVYGSATGVEVRSGAALHVAAGGVISELFVDSGASCSLYDGSFWSGHVTVAGKLSRLSGNGGQVDLTFRIAGGATEGYMLNLHSSEASYSISVARSAESGTRILINDVGPSLEQQTFVLSTAVAELGTLSLGETLRCGGRDYLLTYGGNKLRLAVSGGDAKFAGADVDADGRSDLVMTHTQQGFAGAWLIGEEQTAAWGDLSTMDGSWRVFGLGHAAAGSCADVYLYDAALNAVGAWITDENGKVAGWETVGGFDADTQVVGLGDFNGDGQTDLLLRNANGAVGCHLTDGTGWNYFQSLGDEWTVAAVGDLNGDGRSDVVLKHDAGFAGSWLTQEDCTMAWADLDTLPEGFSIAGCGDFNGDGVDDVLLRTGNYFGAWIVGDGNAKRWMGLGTLNAGTELEEIGDFDGDGVDDLRVRSSDGDLGALCVAGDGKLEWHYYGSVGAEWTTSLAASV